MGAIIARLAAPDKAFGDCLFLRSITTLVHPSRCEGPWFLLGRSHCVYCRCRQTPKSLVSLGMTTVGNADLFEFSAAGSADVVEGDGSAAEEN